MYLDDTLIGADTQEQLAEILNKVFKALREVNATLKPSKIRIGYEKEVILGSEVSKKGIRPAMEHLMGFGQ